MVSIDIQKIHFDRQQGGDNTVVYLRAIRCEIIFLNVYSC
jgi:hypothetical protein